LKISFNFELHPALVEFSGFFGIRLEEPVAIGSCS